MTFILDSGATETVITPPAARELGVRGFGPASMRKGKVRSVSVGKATARNLSVYIFDPPQALSLRLDKGINYCGILGYTFMSKFITTIDFKTPSIRFDSLNAAGPPAGQDAGKPGVHVIPFDLKNHLIYVNGRVDGKGPMTFIVDTGAAEVMILPKAAEALNLSATQNPAIKGVGFTTINHLSVGTASVQKVPAIIHSLPQETKSTPDYHGIIGYPFLSNFKVTINYKKKILILTKTD